MVGIVKRVLINIEQWSVLIRFNLLCTFSRSRKCIIHINRKVARRDYLHDYRRNFKRLMNWIFISCDGGGEGGKGRLSVNRLWFFFCALNSQSRTITANATRTRRARLVTVLITRRRAHRDDEWRGVTSSDEDSFFGCRYFYYILVLFVVVRRTVAVV